MTTTEVCNYLRISRPTLYKRIKDNRLKPLPRENLALDIEPLRFNRADVERLASAARPPVKPEE